jgi:hypothetical protein
MLELEQESEAQAALKRILNRDADEILPRILPGGYGVRANSSRFGLENLRLPGFSCEPATK